jgi:hypothetical protein
MKHGKYEKHGQDGTLLAAVLPLPFVLPVPLVLLVLPLLHP